MGIAKELHFDIFLPGMKEQTQPKVFEALAVQASALCATEPNVLLEVFQTRLSERTFGMGNGVAIFDVRSSEIRRPVLVMSTFERDVDFNALDGKPANIMAAVISPQVFGPSHLQRLASVSRVLRSSDL